MPNTREKLIELLSQVQYLGGLEEKIADHLIANGVTVQKWIPVSERLPEEDDKYLVYMGWGRHYWCEVLSFAKDGRKVDKYDFNRDWENVWYRYDSECGYLTIDNVTHWMHLPEPPKGE